MTADDARSALRPKEISGLSQLVVDVKTEIELSVLIKFELIPQTILYSYRSVSILLCIEWKLNNSRLYFYLYKKVVLSRHCNTSDYFSRIVVK